MKKLVVEYKEGFQPSNDTIKTNGGIIMFTPDIDKDYYIMKVNLYKDQALVAFPKFGLIGVGFALESDWNTNLPYQTDTERLYNWIKRNKKYRAITKQTCLEGLKLLQDACKNYEKEQKEKAEKEFTLSMNEVNHTIIDTVNGISRRKRRDY
jgi:hypothetical protein